MKRKNKHRGFTLVEILLTITLLGILASISLIGLSPNRQLSQSRDLIRQRDITDIQQALESYSIKNKGFYPEGVAVGIYKEICGETINANCVDLSGLVPSYINNIPLDPSGSNYLIGVNPNNNGISVWADQAEKSEIVINKIL
jgi:general secretion pathway protein G